jgi:hypothetical protein
VIEKPFIRLGHKLASTSFPRYRARKRAHTNPISVNRPVPQ